jgi:hypothetical protein
MLGLVFFFWYITLQKIDLRAPTGFRTQTDVALVHTTHLLSDMGFSTVIITVARANVTILTGIVLKVQFFFFFAYSLFKDAILMHEQALRIITFPELTAPYKVH